MKISSRIILCVAVMSMREVNGLNCNDFPKGHPGECCRTSGHFTDVEKISKIVDGHKDKNFSDYMMECKINEDLFEELKLKKGNDVDIDAVAKYFDKAFSDEISAQNYKAATQKCFKEISSNFAKIQAKYEAPPFELSKSKCNVKFMAMMTCVEFQTFLNCPKDYAVVSKTCDEVLNWMKDCTKNTYSFKEIISRFQPK